MQVQDAASVFGGVISGSGGLVKLGPGTLTIATNSSNTYTGTTQILAGTLQVDGALGAAEPAQSLTVAAGAILTGGGDVRAPIYSNAPTARIDSSGNLSLGDGSTSGFDFAGEVMINSGHTVRLRDADLAQLGRTTMLASGAQLIATSGVEVGAGEMLAGSGAIAGNVIVRTGGQVFSRHRSRGYFDQHRQRGVVCGSDLSGRDRRSSGRLAIRPTQRARFRLGRQRCLEFERWKLSTG